MSEVPLYSQRCLIQMVRFVADGSPVRMRLKMVKTLLHRGTSLVRTKILL